MKDTVQITPGEPVEWSVIAPSAAQPVLPIRAELYRLPNQRNTGTAATVGQSSDTVFVQTLESSLNIDVSISGNLLTVKGERCTETKNDEDSYYYRECSYGSFSRTIPLPSEINEDKAEAVYDKGVLEINLPKIVKTKTKKVSVAKKKADTKAKAEKKETKKVKAEKKEKTKVKGEKKEKKTKK